jgi:hypothetical protein
VNDSLQFTLEKFKAIFFSLILLEVIGASTNWRAAAIIKTEKKMVLLNVLNKHSNRTTGSLGLSTSPKTNETLKEVINGQIQRQEYQLQFQTLDTRQFN